LNQEKIIKEIKLGLFGKVFSHNFDDCVKKSWNNFTINTPDETKYVDCQIPHIKQLIAVCFMKKYFQNLNRIKIFTFLKILNEIDKSNSLYLIVCLILQK